MSKGERVSPMVPEGGKDVDPHVKKTLREGKRKRKCYPSEDNRVKATYDLPKGLIDDIKAIAKELKVPHYDVARKFLQYGLEAYQTGDLPLTVKSVKVHWGLE